MATFDAETGKLVARVVFDGPGDAGKTTNLQQLCLLFGTSRRGELVTPEENERGETVWFDWLRLDGGIVQGHPLRCHLITVPGQDLYQARRDALLDRADAVVFVCDSHPEQVELAKPRAAALAERLERLGAISARLVLQANKQDQHGVLEPARVREVLGYPDDVRAVGAKATLGIGVRESAMFAVRYAVDLARRTIEERGLEALTGEVETAAELLEHLVALDAPPPSQDVDGSVLELDESLELPEIESPPSDRQVTLPAAASLSPPSSSAGPATDGGLPPWPQADAPAGMIWPAVRGREVVAALDPRRAERRRDAEHPDAILFHAGPWRIETSPYRRYGTETEARVALSHLARAKVSLGKLLPTDTVLVIADGGADVGRWLWTITPRRPTLRHRMGQAAAAGDEAGLSMALEDYARVAVESLELAAERGIILDLHPSKFAMDEETITYVDDDIAVGSRLPDVGRALLDRVVEFPDRLAPIQRYVEALERELTERLDKEVIEQLALEEALRDVGMLPEPAERARARLIATLERVG